MNASKRCAVLKFIIFSAIGIFIFFIPVEIRGKSTIPLDHIVSGIRGFPQIALTWALIVITIGGIHPWITSKWKESKTDLVFSALRTLGIPFAYAVYFNYGPSWLLAENVGPFVYNKIAVPVSIIVPIGAVFLSFLIGYGLLEFVGTILRPLMRRIWKVPGRAAIDALASFVGSYSIGLIITGRVFKEGRYTIKEATIIATGFSTVSVTFMIIVAKTLDLMYIWTTFFVVALVVTFATTAITARLWPITKKTNEYMGTSNPEEEKITQSLFRDAWNRAIKRSQSAPAFHLNILSTLKDGFRMVLTIIPTITSIGIIGVALAHHTPLFDLVGYIFYPFTYIIGLPEASLAGKALATEIAEMYIPCLLVMDAPLITRFVVGTLSISTILFFSASIPCILATDIPISIPELMLIWIERTIIGIFLAGAIGWCSIALGIV